MHTTPQRRDPAHADSEAIEARYAVIATGAATGLLSRAGILRRQPKVMLAARAYFEDSAPTRTTFQLRFDGVPLPGYGWVFPVGNGVANIGVGFLPRSHAPRRAHRVRRIRRRAPIGGAPASARCAAIRFASIFCARRPMRQRTLLVGEAAGLVNPLTGEGIDYALESGQIAAAHPGALTRSIGVRSTTRRCTRASARSFASASTCATGTVSRCC